MATPPPEGFGGLKEDKPHFPPVLSEVAPAASLNRSPDSLVNGSARSAEKDASTALNRTAVNDNRGVAPTLNGKHASQSPVTNGSEVDGKNRPASDPLDSSSTVKPEPAEPAQEDQLPGTQLSSKGFTDDSAASEPEKVKGESPFAGNTDNVPFENSEHTQDDVPAAPITTLPHHPNVVQESTESKAIPGDQEMTDAPSSPAKVSRERELDPEEEPAAKRARTNGDISPDVSPKAVDDVSRDTISSRTFEGSLGITPLQQKFLAKALTSLKRSNDSRFYREPVDPIKLNIPSYFTVITQPMDLSTIDDKLKKNKYASVAEVAADVDLMTQNAVRFNGPDHVVSVEGARLKNLFHKHLEKLPKPDEVEEKKPKKVVPPKEPAPRREPRVTTQPAPKQTNATSPTFALNPEGLPTIRRDSTNPDGRPKRAIHAPKRDLLYSAKPKKKKFQWELKFCQELLDELHKPKYWTVANPFYFPVDPVALNIPTYHSVIKKPMDLSTIQTKLKAGQYENAKELEADVRLMFKNCYKFNIPGDPIYQAGQKLEEIFNHKWANKSHWLEQHDPENHNQSSSDEDSEEEESEDDADQEKLQALQRQIAEMSKQVEAITQKKKKTPPASKKSGKPKAGKKDSKKSSSKGDKKAKSSKSEKRHVTYHEKQLISNGISTLPDKKMQEALKIIQNNVPALKGTQETEIELDIDELPNEVLVMLLKFVKKNAPQVMDDDDVSAPLSAAVQSKPKKNKPMSKFEQEAQINMLEGSLSRFQGGGGTRSPEPMRSVEGGDSSDESDDDSEESEEE